jgi:DNA-binding response OmpR family regulator
VSESHKEVGTGIGLALVKELVSLMGGPIEVKSEVGNGFPGEQTGSEFITTLPLELINAPEEAHVETSEQEISIEQPTVHIVQNKIAFDSADDHQGLDPRAQVLVVEDNADLRSFIIESLGDEFHFLQAENGRQGLDLATSEIPDLIISDVMMPEMDGITMAGKIKVDSRTSHIPLILLTAKSTEASKLTGLESGADDYLTKPFNKHELLLKIRNGVSRQQKLREKLIAELMSEAPRKEVLSADEQFLERVKNEILKQLSNEQLSVESLAEEIGISRVHLYRKISGLTGMSVNELIRKLRLRRAGQLLEQRWGPVSQIAYEVGFSNLSYFSKVFKEEFGVLPSEYFGTKIK